MNTLAPRYEFFRSSVVVDVERVVSSAIADLRVFRAALIDELEGKVS